MGIDYLTIDGVSTRDFGVMLLGPGEYSAPGRSYESVSVPGRNGNILFDNGKYENIIVRYPAGIIGPTARLDEFRAWLLSHTTYCRIEDSYHNDEYRIGAPVSGLIPSVKFMRNAAKFTIAFDCKPQRFLKSGENEIVLNNGAIILNETRFCSKPLIIASSLDEHGNTIVPIDGAIAVGGDTITIAPPPGEELLTGRVWLDCDIEDAYFQRGGNTPAYNFNAWVTLSGSSYPKLSPGSTDIAMSGNITELRIAPRWWTL